MIPSASALCTGAEVRRPTDLLGAYSALAAAYAFIVGVNQLVQRD